ncbi:MAG: biotin transporter BioY [Clostridiales bacterium]|nr:biotin transporter BioY [Clostridiales bacterium]
MKSEATKKPKLTIYEIAMIAVITAVTCILAPLSIPIGPVPISLTSMVIYFSLYILGWKKATISCIIYLLIGLAGVPVFSGFTSGPAKLFGTTGGYLIGFIPMALIAGIFIEKFYGKWYLCLLGMILGTIVCYALGTAWLAVQANMGLKAALMAGVIPFIIGDLIKMILAMKIGPLIRKRLASAKLLDK